MAAGKRRGGHVEKPIEENLHGAVVYPSNQFSGGGPADELVDGVGGREPVVDDVPVAVVVLGVEAGDPQGGRVGDRPGELFGARAGVPGPIEGPGDLVG